MLPEQYAILDLSADLRARQCATLELAVPHLLGVVQWREGPRLATEFVGIDADALRVGMPVTPVFTDIPGDEPDAGVTLLHYTAG